MRTVTPRALSFPHGARELNQAATLLKRGRNFFLVGTVAR